MTSPLPRHIQSNTESYRFYLLRIPGIFCMLSISTESSLKAPSFLISITKGAPWLLLLPPFDPFPLRQFFRSLPLLLHIKMKTSNIIGKALFDLIAPASPGVTLLSPLPLSLLQVFSHQGCLQPLSLCTCRSHCWGYPSPCLHSLPSYSPFGSQFQCRFPQEAFPNCPDQVSFPNMPILHSGMLFFYLVS